MFGLGFWEMLLVGVIAVMLYGKRLPEVAKSFGATYRQFRRQLNDLQSQF
jgi:sec-independent protein translocase protein TatA